jgi:hypothetical protein
MTGNKDLLVNVKRCAPVPIKLADGTVVVAQFKGDMLLRLKRADKPDKHTNVKIPDVYYHDRFDVNLLSWGKMREDGWQLHSDKDRTYLVTPNKKHKIFASTRGRLTILDCEAFERALTVLGTQCGGSAVSKLEVLHRRLGHISWHRMLKLCKKQVVVGVPDVDTVSDIDLERARKMVQDCTACAQGKAHRNPLGHQGLDKGTEAGEVIHMDTAHVTRRNPQTGDKEKRYCLVATDAHTEWRWVAIMTSMADVPQAIIDVLRNSHTITSRRPRLLISDLGSEFDNGMVERYCKQRGIKMQPSPPRTKELNGLSEKSVDTVKNHARSMLHAAGISNDVFNEYAILQHAYLWNRTHIGRSTGVTPYEAMLKRKPSVLHVGEFGCDVCVTQDKSQRDTTFSPKSDLGIYLGHDYRMNCARVYNLRKNKIIHTKDVQFREGSFKHIHALMDGRTDVVEEPDGTEATSQELPVLQSGRDEHERTKMSVSDSDADVEDNQPSDPTRRWQLRSIVNSRTANGRKEYQVKWVGSPTLTWEPASTIEVDAPEAVNRYKEFTQNRASGHVTRSQARQRSQSETSSETDNDSHNSVEEAALDAAERL